MTHHRIILAALAVVSTVLLLASCTEIGDPVLPTRERVTFALVINTRAYNDTKVIALLKEGLDDPALETIEGFLESYPNTSTQAWAQMTTLEKIWTNQRYFLLFFLDLDDSGTRSSGDLEGVQHFEVTSNAVWSETKYFHEELTAVP